MVTDCWLDSPAIAEYPENKKPLTLSLETIQEELYTISVDKSCLRSEAPLI